MRKKGILAATLIISFAFIAYSTTYAQSADEFKQRRERLMERLRKGVAIFKSAPVYERNRDVNYEYRQSSNFYYLTGLSEPNAALILIPQKIYVRRVKKFTKEILFVQPWDPKWKAFTGRRLSVEGAKEKLGFDVVLGNDEFEKILPRILSRADTLYYSYRRIGLDEPLTEEMEFFKRAKERFYDFEVINPQSLIGEMRRVKSASELKLLRKAIAITVEALKEAMRSAEPGMYEYELEALIEYVFRRKGAERTAFSSIVASGPNALILHYDENNRQAQAGDLVLIDVGAEYHMYSADLTRTIPISGEFSEAQKEIYNIVLKAQKAAIEAIKPGMTITDIDRVARRIIADAGYGKFVSHGVSHYLGIDVHDVGNLLKPFEPGVVITVEPGIYIPEGAKGVDPKYWNIGIRIEDDVLVTESGCEVLSDGVPKEIEEIEHLMKEKGIGNIAPGEVGGPLLPK